MPNTVQIPEKTWRKIERFLDQLAAEPTEWINEEEACKLLGVKKQTMWTNVSTGKIPRSHYSIGVCGNRFYDKKKLMGI